MKTTFVVLHTIFLLILAIVAIIVLIYMNDFQAAEAACGTALNTTCFVTRN